MMCPDSVRSLLRNLRRAGTGSKRCSTSIRVPTGRPQAFWCTTRPALTTISVPESSPASRVWSVKRDTLAMEGSASPRKPKVESRSRSAASAILLVA
jgi:hypothetical protein